MDEDTLLEQAQAIAGEPATAASWLAFAAIYNQTDDQALKFMLSDLATGLMRELVANQIPYKEDALS
ncbi:MAG: hypothetical protein ACI9T9_002156 [Oleiphilaceae bacterium]|jgi:hypothetical protein